MSSPAGTPIKKAKVELTARDVELLAFAMQSMKDPNVQIDYEKFAGLAGMTDGSARVTWGKIRRKLTAASGQADTPASAKSQAAPKSKAKRVRKRKGDEQAEAGGEENEDAGTPESPTKLIAERRKKAKKVKKEVEAEAEAEVNEEEAGTEEEGNGAKVKAEAV